MENIKAVPVAVQALADALQGVREVRAQAPQDQADPTSAALARLQSDIEAAVLGGVAALVPTNFALVPLSLSAKGLAVLDSWMRPEAAQAVWMELLQAAGACQLAGLPSELAMGHAVVLRHPEPSALLPLDRWLRPAAARELWALLLAAAAVLPAPAVAQAWTPASDLPREAERVWAFNGVSSGDCFYGRQSPIDGDTTVCWRHTLTEEPCRWPVVCWQPLAEDAGKRWSTWFIGTPVKT